MSSVIPKRFRSGKKPSNFEDINPNVKFVTRAVQIALGKDIYITGSYANSLPALDSDIDIIVINYDILDDDVIKKLSTLFNIKIDVCNGASPKEQFKVNELQY